MKKLPFIVLIAWILILSWCQAPLIETIKSAKNQTFDCSQPHYYENLKLNKKVSFARDETAQNYQLTIPELCLKLTAYPDDQVPLQDWKKAVQADAAHGFLVKNNALESQNADGYRIINHFLIKDKNPDQDLDTAVQSDYQIRTSQNLEINGQKYCTIIPDERAQEKVVWNLLQHPTAQNSLESYRLLTYNELAPQENDEFRVGGQVCGNNYPFWRDNFDQIRNHQILYSTDRANRYLIYSVDDSQDPQYSLFHNIEVVFTDKS